MNLQEMDPGRSGVQQGWDNNSALEGYGYVHEPNFRGASSYDERRSLDERYSRDDIYSRRAPHRDVLERENYPPPPPATGPLSQSRRRSYEEEYPLERDAGQHDKPYFDSYNETDTFHDSKFDKQRDDYHSVDNYRDHEFDRTARFGRDRDNYAYEGSDYHPRMSHQNREDSRERDYDSGRYSYDSDSDRGTRWRDSRDREHDKKGLSRERDQSPHGRYEPSRSRSRSRGRDDRPRSRSPRSRSHGQSHREDGYNDDRYERIEKRRDRDERHPRDRYSVAPSATVVVKGLSHQTTEEDLYQILAEWGPLRHVRVIKERNSGVSRGYAFIDFSSTGAARAMMDKIGEDGLVIDGRKLFFEYSKPTGGSGGPYGLENAGRSGYANHKSMTMPSDWMCTICGCVNFARRTSCFQCNEPRGDDAPPAGMSSNPTPMGKRGSEAGPTHVLVVRGLDENADEEMLRYEFSKHAPIKDLRLVRDKFTHVSRGFAFVHFHSVEDATKALDVTHGTTLEKNGQILRVAYAKSILGSGSGTAGSSHSSSLAAAAIEAAAFSQQYDAVGWAPKEYNPNDKQSTSCPEQSSSSLAPQTDGSAVQSGFVWDEASGYYYDAASGFYYDGNTGLYYDGNSGIWYSCDNQTQQYTPCTEHSDKKSSNTQPKPSKGPDGSNSKKTVISAPSVTIVEKAGSLPEAVQAAAAAAIAAEKKEKERLKEIKLASKSSILANKKKMNNVLSMWKQRSHEGQATRVALEDNQPTDDRIGQSARSKLRSDAVITRDNSTSSSGVSTAIPVAQTGLDYQMRQDPVSSSSSGTLRGVIRAVGRGVVKSETSYLDSPVGVSTSSTATAASGGSSLATADLLSPFRTDVSALGSYTPPVATGSGRRRFSEMPLSASVHKEQAHTPYRDRAAERRSLYGSSSFLEDSSELGFGNSNRDLTSRKGGLDSMPFPPGVGGGRGAADATSNAPSFEVITADKAIDESNVGNRMLRSMGWQEGLGLGKDGSGMVEPVQAQGTERRAGLGNQAKKVDPDLEVQAGDSYRTLIQKKALARFREMS